MMSENFWETYTRARLPNRTKMRFYFVLRLLFFQPKTGGELLKLRLLKYGTLV